MPLKHKEKNTIKFMRFSERINSISVDIIHRVGHRNEEDDVGESESYFYLALQKWNDLNCSQGWKEFSREVSGVRTLAQVLLLKERTVSSLLAHLEKKDPLTIQAILEMVVALARDLRKEFYPYYHDVLTRVVDLLNTKDVEVLEWSFQCLAYLFKFLWRCMVRSIEQVLSSLLPLLSQKCPKYINYFAADSFAFLARKVKDQMSFVSLILNHLKNQPEDVDGCGRLVFAWMRGIKGQLHSNAQSLLQLLFRSLGSQSLPTDLLESLLSRTLTHLAVETRPGGLKFLWEAVETSLVLFSSDNNTDWEAATRVLALACQVCQHNEAIHLTSPNLFIERLLALFHKSKPLPESVVSRIADIVAVLLLSPTASVSQQHAVKLTTQIMSSTYHHITFSFVEKLLRWGSLELLLLPRLLNLLSQGFIHDKISTTELRILAKLIHCKAPPVCVASDLADVRVFELDFSSGSGRAGASADHVGKNLLKVLKETENFGTFKSIQEKIYSLTILPHVKPLNKNDVLKALKNHLVYVLKYLKEISSEPQSNDEHNSQTNRNLLSQLLLMLLASFEAAIRIMDSEKGLERIVDVDVVLQTLLPLACQNAISLSALRALNIYLEAINFHKISNKMEVCTLIYNSLKLNLANAHHLVREMTCRIFLQLPVAEELHSIFQLCFEAEKIEASITDYRDKLQRLKKLSYESTHSTFIKNKDFEMAPLYLLMGSLYINFKLLWEPLQALIASYATGMAPSEFWPVYHAQLVLGNCQRDLPSDHATITHSSFECTLLSNYFSSTNDVDDKPDYPHYRLLLWQTMQHFPEVCEARNRDVASLFLSFMESEYYRADAESAISWNIKKYDDISDTDSVEKMEDSEEDEESENEELDSDDENGFTVQINNESKKPKSTRRKPNIKKIKTEKALSARLLTKTLLTKLGLLSKMRNPRAMHREPDLNRIYHDLVSHKNQNIQKAALECIMTYKHKYLMPYSQHLFALIDSKSYKTEMLSFSISKESDAILSEHRPQLIPLIIKIVYSKMTAKTGMRTGGKSSATVRRSNVLRFIAGCHEEEMLLFIEMAFRFYSHLLKDDPNTMSRSIQSSIDLQNVIPPRRLQSSVNLLSVVLEQFGGLMGNKLLGLVLRLLICVGTTVKSILSERESVHISYHNPLRLLRNSCLEVLTQFFDRFEAYPWNASEIDTVLDVFVWPSIERLPIEGAYSPTALMKLFTVWSQHPRYFILFGACSPISSDLTTLPALMSLLLSPKSHPSVCNAVMEILENLLTLKDHQQFVENANAMELDEIYTEERAPAVPVTHVLAVNQDEIRKLNLSATPNLGSRLVYPHIPSILERLRQRLIVSSKRGSGLTKRELLVLTAVSEFVCAPETSATLAHLLLPILIRRTAAPVEDEEPVLKMMNTLCHLLKNVDNPQSYVRPIAPLFNSISGVAGRKMLASLINVLAEASNAASQDTTEELKLLTSIASRLNAYDARWIEQPDFDRRLDAFKEVQTLLDAGKLTVDIGVIVIYQCFYTIRSEKDLSLRDFASHSLRYVAPRLCLSFKNDAANCRYLVDNTILALIRSSLNKTSSESLQGEAVLLLGEMARECCDLHPVLKDLHPLTNKSDPEVDFFENLQHLQLHRKTRALLKVCEVFSLTEKAPGPRTLTHFILPLAVQFLCCDKYSGKNSLADAAINVIGVVCRLLPWHQYEAVLRFYLGRLRMGAMYQKQLVRIVAAILDSFHFDLSRAEMAGILKYKSIKKDLKEEENKQTSETSEIDKVDENSLIESTENIETDLSVLEQHLNSAEETEQEVDESEMDVEESKAVLAISKQAVLCPSAATRAVRTIVVGLLPQLNRTLTARTVLESSHKLNKKQVQNNHPDRDAEEEEMLRVPMALAVVKLLKQLPSEMLAQNLPGIFAKLCTFLKSRLESVRKITRETLQKVMVALGPSYLEMMLSEMTSLLTRGFQVHVLVFCIHSVLIALKDTFAAGDIDSSVLSIIEVCKTDLFGSVAEEREEGKVSSKLREARSSKSYDTLHLISQFVDENHLTNVLLPFKEVIQSARSHKVINKASEGLRHIVLGLSDNTFVSPTSLMIFGYGVASESIPALSFKNKKEKIVTQEEKELKARRRQDCLIIPEAPKNHVGIKCTDAARVAARMNAHLFVDFGLRLIYSLLRREKLKESEVDARPFLDPVVSLLNDCLSSQHVKLCTLSLQCLTWLFPMDLPSLRKQMSVITASIFGLLHKFAASGMSKGDNFDLVVAGFKAVAVIVRDVKYHTLEQDQLKALLLYAEQDFADINRHATAFALLKAILSRKLIVTEIHDVMDRVATLSITSEVSYVRQQARSVFYQFLMDYPIGAKMKRHLSFYLSQLNFEMQTGRESALEMVNLIVSSFPVTKLAQHCELFFLMLGARLINDDSPDCRKMVAQCITKMLSRLERSNRDSLYNMNLLWLQDKQVSHRQLAAQLCGLFVEIEKKSFRGRLTDLFPIIISQFSPVVGIKSNEPGKQLISNGSSHEVKSESEKTLDHHLYQVLQLVLKISSHCPEWLVEPSFSDHVSDITEHVSALLAHPHEWVRLASAQILTHALSTLDCSDISKALCEEGAAVASDLGFFKTDTRSKLKGMILDHCAQLRAGVEVEQQLLFQVVKNLVIFADILKDVHSTEENDDNASAFEDKRQTNLSLQWLVRRMRRIFNAEVTRAPRSTVMRTMVLNWTAAVVVKLGNEFVRPVLHDLLAPVVRERSNDDPPAEGSPQAQLRSLAKEVGALMKKTVGTEYYIQTQSRLQILLSTKRAERRKILKLEAVTEPEKAAKRKAQKQVRKKGAKKRRTMMMKGKKLHKKREICIDD